MGKKAEERRPQSHMEVEGLLCKNFYKRFGKAVLPMIEEVFRQWGRVLGERMKKKLGDVDFKTAVLTYIKPATKREPKAEIIEATEKRVELKVYACPYILNGQGQELCEAMMAMDREIINAIIKDEVRLELPKTLAKGDDYCHAILTRLTTA
nr:hypothetical protein [Desulfobacterales bacterium]